MSERKRVKLEFKNYYIILLSGVVLSVERNTSGVWSHWFVKCQVKLAARAGKRSLVVVRAQSPALLIGHGGQVTGNQRTVSLTMTPFH